MNLKMQFRLWVTLFFCRKKTVNLISDDCFCNGKMLIPFKLKLNCVKKVLQHSNRIFTIFKRCTYSYNHTKLHFNYKSFPIYLKIRNILGRLCFIPIFTEYFQSFWISFDNHCKYMIENIMTTLKAKMVVLNVSLNMI